MTINDSPCEMVTKAKDRTQAYIAEESRGQAMKTGKLFPDEGKEGCVTVVSLKMGEGKIE